ncbi:MAG: histidinol-phosphate transaminase [Mycobacteriaceae bacterium]
MTARTRPDLDELPSYVPGRSAPGAVKLASNEVSAPPLPSVVQAIVTAAAGVNRYPDTASTALANELARRLEVDPAQVVVGNGSVSLCQQLVAATCSDGDEVVFAWRSFEAYPLVVRGVGAVPVTVPLTATHGHDLDAMLAAIGPRTRLVFVCNPNNPTSTVVRSDELNRFLDAVPGEVLVVLDEAYTEFVRDGDVPDGIALTRGRDNVAVLRTFSKAYGLAGLRVGYTVAPVPVAAAVRKVGVPFGVSGVAQAAALACLDAADELLARCDDLVLERDRVRTALVGAGYDVPTSEANFLWLPVGEGALDLAQRCADGGVLVRAFAGAGVRVSTGTRAENDAFLRALDISC